MNQSPTSLEPLPLGRALIHAIRNCPLWVRQVLYVELQAQLKQHFVDDSLNDLTPEDALALFIPRLTAEGSRADNNATGDRAKLLQSVKQSHMVIDICIENNWSLEHCCKLLHDAIAAQWVAQPTSKKALGTIEFLANAIRLGEYLVKMGRLTEEQLSQALRTQQYIQEAMNEHTGIANILINLGYITRKDTEGILFLKEESKQPLSTDLFKLFVN